MKTTIKFRGQDKPVVLDNIQIAQQRVPMYIVAQGDTRYRFSLDTIEKIVEEGVMSDPADFVSASETDTAGPKADGTGVQTAKTSYRKVGVKIDLSLLNGKLDMDRVIPRGIAGLNIWGFSKGEVATRIQEVLGIGQTQSYRIVNQLIKERKIRTPKDNKGNVKVNRYDVVDPALNPGLRENYESMRDDPEEPYKGTFEQWMEEHLKEGFN